jgi:hypothetical protein
VFLRVLTFVLALCASSPAAADALYDVGSNTTFATFSAAFSQALVDQSGPFGVTAHVRVLDPVYNNSLDLDAGLTPLQPQPGAGLVIEAGPGLASATLSGLSTYGVRVSGVANVTIQGLHVQGFSVNSVKLESTSGSVLNGLSLDGAGAGAVDARSCTQLQVLNSEMNPQAGTGGLLSGCSQVLLQGNVVNGTPSYGLVAQYSNAVLMDGNRADNADYAFNVFSCNNVTVSANVAIGRSSKRGLVLESSDGSLILKNLLVGQDVGMELQASAGCAVYQNTVWEHNTAALYANVGSSNLALRNNLWQGFIAYFLDSVVQTTLSSNNNGFQYTARLASGIASYDSLAAWQAQGFDAGSRADVPGFVGVAGTQPKDYKLQLSSPMLGYGTDMSAVYNTDYFGNHLSPFPAPWDPGIHVASAPQNTPTVTPTATPLQPAPTASPTATLTISPTFTPSPIGTATPSPSPQPTATVTATATVTPYPYQRDRVITYPNPWSPNGAPLNIAYEPADSVSIRLFDMSGELVQELPASALRPNLGYAQWDGRERDGGRVPSGLYFCVVVTPKGTHFTRFTVLY